MAVSVKVTSNASGISSGLLKASRAGAEAALLIIEAQAKANAPVDTGEMRDHITHTITMQGSKIIGKVGSPTPWSLYVEFGTGEFAENGAGRKGGWSYVGEDGIRHFTYGNKPTKFLRNAFKSTKPQVKAVIAASYRR